MVLPLYLGACLLLGGASAAGVLANAALQLAALLLIGWLLVRRPSPREGFATVRNAALLIAALAIVELVPLPPALWTALPGRAPIAHGFTLLGIPTPWSSLSLDRERCIATLLGLLPPFAIAFAALAAEPAVRARAAGLAVVVALLEIGLGALQISGGFDSPFYFYQITNRGLAVGTFANRNHLATLLLMALPFAALAFARAAGERNRQKRQSRRMAASVLAGLLVLGLVLNGSSAALTLLFPTLAACAFLYRREVGKPLPARAGLACAGLLVLLLLFALFGPFHEQFLDKAISVADPTTRRTSSTLTLQAARDFMPFGSGLGTFLHIYPRYEALDRVLPTYVNHAHNDLAELLLEAGLAGAAIVVALLVWGLLRARLHWRTAEGGGLGRAASIAFFVPLAHSLVDYPLRTAAVASFIALAAAVLAAAPQATAPRARSARSSRQLVIE